MYWTGINILWKRDFFFCFCAKKRERTVNILEFVIAYLLLWYGLYGWLVGLVGCLACVCLCFVAQMTNRLHFIIATDLKKSTLYNMRASCLCSLWNKSFGLVFNIHFYIRIHICLLAHLFSEFWSAPMIHFYQIQIHTRTRGTEFIAKYTRLMANTHNKCRGWFVQELRWNGELGLLSCLFFCVYLFVLSVISHRHSFKNGGLSLYSFFLPTSSLVLSYSVSFVHVINTCILAIGNRYCVLLQ